MDAPTQSFHNTADPLHFLLKFGVILLDVIEVLVGLFALLIVKLIVYILLQQL